MRTGWLHVRRDAPTHALMIVIMVIAMASQSAAAYVLGAAVLIAVSVGCAALSKSRTFLREHVLDLWAMALVLLAFLPQGSANTHHAMAIPAFASLPLVFIVWTMGRVALAARAPRASLAPAAVSAFFTAAGLAMMAVFCSL